MSTADISIIGQDRKGIVASITNYIFNNKCNVEEVNQNVMNNIFYMSVKISFKPGNFDKIKFKKGLENVSRKVGVKSRIFFDGQKRKKNMAILVTKEEHVLTELLKENKRGRLKVNIPIIIGTSNTLENTCKKFKIKFIAIKDKTQSLRENKILKILEEYEIDFIVLARYMKILSPKFVWNYPNRIINIHPSLLPSFPGAMAYMQAFEKGVRISGATAHFVTVDLDQGPIIAQESFKINSSKSIEQVKNSGRECEKKALMKAVTLFVNNKLECRWGKVIIKTRKT
jgi:formyltetrahydrofolate deformylase|tara:strand:+ start:1453 stop:2307 length:855 start_codon:yes stop_codon:yes gene_type:complete